MNTSPAAIGIYRVASCPVAIDQDAPRPKLTYKLPKLVLIFSMICIEDSMIFIDVVRLA